MSWSPAQFACPYSAPLVAHRDIDNGAKCDEGKRDQRYSLPWALCCAMCLVLFKRRLPGNTCYLFMRVHVCACASFCVSVSSNLFFHMYHLFAGCGCLECAMMLNCSQQVTCTARGCFGSPNQSYANYILSFLLFIIIM